MGSTAGTETGGAAAFAFFFPFFERVAGIVYTR
jgi:hypothetical protein